MAKVDFISLSNIIFKDKDKYKYVTDEEKNDCFFKLNRKFAIKYLKQAQFFNNKNVNRASAIDVWFQVFYKITNGTPSWWWLTKKNKETVKTEFVNKDLKMIKDFYELTDYDIKFLTTYFKDDLKIDIKRIKKFNN